MVMPRKLPIDFGVAFPYGVFAMGEVTPVRDYDRSTREAVVQATDPDSGLLVWAIDIIDADPEARKSNRVVSVKVPARVQPVLPEVAPGLPFRPVAFDGMTATAYVEESGDYHRIAWSFRATAVREPQRGQSSSPKPAADKAVA